ncbi:MAG TPA: replicative DNA helicase [Acholeplasmataceae bacterium]|jgi:replicative DNA helicase|nr:replicative DNA helicase [Acholeplasmataceae bacterium]
MMEIQRQIPCSREAENYVLGSVLIENRLVPEVVSQLDYTDFYYPENINIMNAIIALDKAKKEIDVSSVIEYLKQKGLYEATGGGDYLFELMDAIPSVANVAAYIQIIKEKAVERELLNKMQELSNQILDRKLSFEEIIDTAERNIIETLNKRKTVDLVRIDNVTDKVLSIIEMNKQKSGDTLTGLDTGFKALNKLTFGFQKGELTILAARPGIGKSALALNFATNACELADAHVAFFSLEMGIDQLLMRLYSSHSGLTLNKIRSGKLNETEMASLYAAKTKLDRFNLYLDEAGATDVEELVTVCRKLKRDGKLDLVIIDYLQLLTTRRKTMNRVDEVSKISRQLKIMARELDVPVLALSQLSRLIEQREDKRPVLSDLRESGSIEQDADIVMFLHRDPIKGDEDTTRRFRSVQTELIIAKNRQGVTDSIRLVFKGAYSMFCSVEDAEQNRGE